MAQNYRLLVNGKWVETEEKVAILSPYDGRLVGKVCRANEKKMEAAIAAAAGAFEKTRRLPAYERSAMLLAIVRGLKEAHGTS